MRKIRVRGSNGKIYDNERVFCEENNIPRSTFRRTVKLKGSYIKNGITFVLSPEDVEDKKEDKTKDYEKEKEYQEYQKFKEVTKKDFTYYKFEDKFLKTKDKYAVALFSDAHIEETVKKESVLGFNEYNIDIAKHRIERYFVGLSQCLIKDGVKQLFFASLGDTISGFIHESLEQENGLTPPQAIVIARSLIISGMKYLKTHNKGLRITFIGMCGNHSRITKRIQYDNGFKLSYEYIMYKDIEDICGMIGLNIKFIIPESDIFLLEMPDKRRFIFIHGYQVKSSGTGTVCGIYPALQRLAMKWDRTFHQDKIFLGHYHSCISIPSATVNGSIIGFNSFAMSNGFSFEEPAQMYELYDKNIGCILTRKIYCK